MFEEWLFEVTQKAAEAGTDGGFLGFGGLAMSEAEQVTLSAIAAALGTSRGAQGSFPFDSLRDVDWNRKASTPWELVRTALLFRLIRENQD